MEGSNYDSKKMLRFSWTAVPGVGVEYQLVVKPILKGQSATAAILSNPTLFDKIQNVTTYVYTPADPMLDYAGAIGFAWQISTLADGKPYGRNGGKSTVGSIGGSLEKRNGGGATTVCYCKCNDDYDPEEPDCERYVKCPSGDCSKCCGYTLEKGGKLTMTAAQEAFMLENGKPDGKHGDILIDNVPIEGYRVTQPTPTTIRVRRKPTTNGGVKSTICNCINAEGKPYQVDCPSANCVECCKAQGGGTPAPTPENPPNTEGSKKCVTAKGETRLEPVIQNVQASMLQIVVTATSNFASQTLQYSLNNQTWQPSNVFTTTNNNPFPIQNMTVYARYADGSCPVSYYSQGVMTVKDGADKVDIIIKSVGANKGKVIETLQKMRNLNLIDATKLANTPSAALKGVTKDEAAAIKSALEGAGAEVK